MVAAEHADADALCALLNEGADETATNNEGTWASVLSKLDEGAKV